jgi:hypothetical protein
MSKYRISVNEEARSLLQQVLNTQQQITDSFICKEPSIQYYGWFSEQVQSKRSIQPQEYILKKTHTTVIPSVCEKHIKSPPYTYWFQGENKVLVTDVTLSDETMERHKETGSVFLGKLDKFCCRSYTKL